MSDEILIQIDEAITQQHQIIARARVEIARLEETRQVVASLRPTSGTRDAFAVGVLTIRRKRSPAIEHQPAPAKPPAVPMPRSSLRGTGTFIRKVLDWFDAHPEVRLAQAELRAAMGLPGDHKSKPAKSLSSALRKSVQRGWLAQDASGAYRLAGPSEPPSAARPRGRPRKDHQISGDVIVETLAAAGKPIGAGEVKQLLGLHSTDHRTSVMLNYLVGQGRVAKEGEKGKYRYKVAA